MNNKTTIIGTYDFKNMCMTAMYEHKSGNISVSAHNVIDVKYTRWHKLNSASDTRKIRVSLENGSELEISLFRNR